MSTRYWYVRDLVLMSASYSIIAESTLTPQTKVLGLVSILIVVMLLTVDKFELEKINAYLTERLE